MLSHQNNKVYKEGLQKLRKMRTLVWVIGLGIIPWGVLTAFISVYFNCENLIHLFTFYILIASIISFINLCIKCPRCGKYFHIGKYYFTNTLSRRCLHCDLHIAADKSEEWGTEKE